MWTPEFTKAFRRKLGAAGYIGMGWPKEYGGGGRSRVYQAIFWDEMEYHRAPGLDRSITYVPNAIMALGSDAQKADFLPQMSRGELSWFVGYSEPEAGSDLASLKTRAVEDGDHFIITGQKAFSSDAHMADYGWVATRTDPTSSKHRGITMFIVDMKSSRRHREQVSDACGMDPSRRAFRSGPGAPLDDGRRVASRAGRSSWARSISSGRRCRALASSATSSTACLPGACRTATARAAS